MSLQNPAPPLITKLPEYFMTQSGFFNQKRKSHKGVFWVKRYLVHSAKNRDLEGVVTFLPVCKLIMTDHEEKK